MEKAVSGVMLTLLSVSLFAMALSIHVVGLEHDVAVVNVATSKTVVGEGFSLPVNVTVENQGNFAETFNVTTYHNTTTIETETVTNLLSGEETTLTFTWNTTGVAKGNYTISAHATPFPDETDTADNNFFDGIILVSIVGDVNGDGVVDMKDIAPIAARYGANIGTPEYVANYDLNSDGTIDMRDIAPAAAHYDAHTSEPWLRGWTYRKAHNITENSGATQTNYQIKIVVINGSGTDSGDTVYINNKCRSDFGDIRFTNSSGENADELDYWIEEKYDGENATFWVEVDSLSASSNTTIYLYYGKSDALTTSNGKNTFIFFDDFEGDNYDHDVWEKYDGGLFGGVTVEVSNSLVDVHSDGKSWYWGKLVTKSTHWSVNQTLYFYGNFNSVPAGNTKCWGGVTSKYSDANKDHDVIFVDDDYSNNVRASSGDDTNREFVSFSSMWTGWKHWEITRKWNGVDFVNVDDTETQTVSTYYHTADEYITIHSCQSNSSFYLDFFALRNWCSSPPSHKGWGSEETPNPPILACEGISTTLSAASCKFYTHWASFGTVTHFNFNFYDGSSWAAKTRTYVTSDTEQSGYEPSNLIDGSTATQWEDHTTGVSGITTKLKANNANSHSQAFISQKLKPSHPARITSNKSTFTTR